MFLVGLGEYYSTCTSSAHSCFAFVQLIAWSRMDQKQQMKLTQGVAAPNASAFANSRPSSAASSKSSKAASLSPMYPHMYAVELRKPAWLLAMITSAEKSFQDDVRKDLVLLKRSQRKSEAEFLRNVATAAARKKVEWINMQIGATNPPTALYRSVALPFQPTFLRHTSCTYSTDCSLAPPAIHACLLCSSVQHQPYCCTPLPAASLNKPTVCASCGTCACGRATTCSECHSL